MPDRPLVIQVLTTARGILTARGWDCHYSSHPDSPLNIPSAVAAACTRVTDGDSSAWYPAYRDSVAAIRAHIDDGVQSWEFGTHADEPRRRTESEVLAMLGDVIAKVQRAHTGALNRLGTKGGDGHEVSESSRSGSSDAAV